MRQILLRDERHLSQLATEVSRQMTELRQLRELVRLAEAAKTLNRPKGLARSPLDPKVVDPFATLHLRDLPDRLARPDRVR